MRRSTALLALCVTVLVVLAAAPGAFATSSQQTARNVANGKTNVSSVVSSKALKNATVQQYSGPGTKGVMQKASAPLKTSKAAGTLPFTGADLGVFAVVAVALIGGGVLLRRVSRGNSN